MIYDIFVNCNWVVTQWQYYSTHLHIDNTQNNTNNNTTQITPNLEECGPCPVFANFTLAFALQLRKKLGKTSVRVQYTYYQNTHTLQNPHTHTHTHTYAHTTHKHPHITKPTHYIKSTHNKETKPPYLKYFNV